MHIFQFSRYLREVPGEHTFLPISRRRLEFSQCKSLEIRIFLCYKNKARGDIFKEKNISKQLCWNKESYHNSIESSTIYYTAWKVSKYGVFCGPYFSAFGLNKDRYFYLSVFSPNAGKYGPQKTPYLDIFHTVKHQFMLKLLKY